ncbi:hypothetical protein C9925_02165, partial [cyanobacterium G8-9]
MKPEGFGGGNYGVFQSVNYKDLLSHQVEEGAEVQTEVSLQEGEGALGEEGVPRVLSEGQPSEKAYPLA